MQKVLIVGNWKSGYASGAPYETPIRGFSSRRQNDSHFVELLFRRKCL